MLVTFFQILRDLGIIYRGYSLSISYVFHSSSFSIFHLRILSNRLSLQPFLFITDLYYNLGTFPFSKFLLVFHVSTFQILPTTLVSFLPLDQETLSSQMPYYVPPPHSSPFTTFHFTTFHSLQASLPSTFTITSLFPLQPFLPPPFLLYSFLSSTTFIFSSS